MPPTIEASRRWWRQFGFWGLAVTAGAGFFMLAAIQFAAVLVGRDVDLAQVVIAYGTAVAGFVGAAGVRQWGKNAGAENPPDANV